MPRLHPITARRRARGLTRVALARQIGVAETRLAAWEQGRGYPSVPGAVRLARHLQLSLAEVLWTAIEQEADAGRIPPLVESRRAG